MNTLVSIVVAVYNAENCLARCLDSLLSQTYKDIEIICVNDASTDNSQTIINEYVKKDNRVRTIIHEKNMNAGGAMNDGIKAARGEYVCIVDNDDWLDNKCIEVLLEASDYGKIDIVSCDWYRFFADNHKVAISNLSETNDKIDNVHYSLKNGWRLLGALIRKALFVENDLFFPESVFYEDNAIAICILCYAESIRPVHQALYYYFETPTSVTRSISPKKIVDRMRTTQMFYQNMESRGFTGHYNKDLIDYRYLLYSYNTLIMMTESREKWSNSFLADLSKSILDVMPNKTLEKYKPQLIPCLSNPISFYRRRRLIICLKRIIPITIRKWFKEVLNISK